jgi:hypothetical protein
MCVTMRGRRAVSTLYMWRTLAAILVNTFCP